MWQYDAVKKTEGASPRRRPLRQMEIQCQPIVVNGIMYGTTPSLSLFAIKADTGEEIWEFDPFEDSAPRFHVNRGVMFWESGRRQPSFKIPHSFFIVNLK